jgi:hypothetical protein
VCGSETWAVAEMDMNSVGACEAKMLRKIHGPLVAQGIWRIRTGQELKELYEDLDIVAGIKKKRLEWIGYVVGMGEGRRVKKMFESNPDGSRRLRWLEDVEKDLGKMKVKRWRQ